jgi:TolB-like protein
LNDTDHKIVQTLPKKGYKLEAIPLSSVSLNSFGNSGPVSSQTSSKFGSPWPLVLMVLAVLIGVGSFTWRTTATNFEPIDRATLNFPLPDNPSIAVLALDDHSIGNDRDFLSDAIAEGIISELSRFSELFVIARNSSFSFRGKPTDVREIAQSLGVRYVLEGSQQKDGNSLRVTAQLIDALEGHHLWSQSYDRELGELFAVQDDIVRKVVSTVGEKLKFHEGEIAKDSDTSKLTSLQLGLMGRRYFREYTQEGSEKAREASLAAVKAGPNQPYGYIGLTYVYINGYRWGWGNLGREKALAEARKMAQMALDSAPNFYSSHNAMGYVHMQAGERDRAITRFEHALSLNPNSTSAMSLLVEVLGYSGRSEEAEELQILAMRLDPLHPNSMEWNLAWLQWMNGKCDSELKTMQAISQMPSFAYRMLAIIHVCLDQQTQAETAIAQLTELHPGYTIANVRENFRGKYTDVSVLERYLDGLRKAGLSE